MESNIGLFNDCFPPVMDGVAVCVQNYAYWMQKKVGGVSVITPNVPGADYSVHEYEVLPYFSVPVPFRKPYVTGLAEIDPAFLKKIVNRPFKIVHAHCPFASGLAAAHVAKFRSIPMVATFHSKYYDAILEFTKSRTIAKAVTAKIVRLYEECDEVWACSEETGETLRSYGFRKPYFVMPNGTDTSFPADPQGLKARAAERFRIPQGKRVLLFVGQQIWYKNQRLILDAFRLLCDREDDWLLIMVGTGKDEQEIERYAASMNLSGHVIFTGQIKDRELLQGVYLNSDLLFFPSVFDNAPLVLREAAVLGVPTLAVEGSNAAGAIRKNENGFTAAATPEDMSGEIRRIFTETDIRAVGKKARETIPVSWEKLIPMVLDRYRTVIEKYKRDR